MKKITLMLIMIITLIGCTAKNELYKETDVFVESLNTTHESYGMFNISENSKTTSDGIYAISPVGRLINVKILNHVDGIEYENLKDDLKNHYEGDSRVNDVYVCGAGTVMIDCRNNK